MIAWLQGIFSTPARQALGWTGLGLLGFVFALGGVSLLTDDGGGNPNTAVVAGADPESVQQTVAANESATARAERSPSATATRTRTATPSPTASPTPAETPTTTPTRRPAAGGSGGTGGQTAATPTPVPPTATPTSAPVVANGSYCDTASSGNVSVVSRIAGTVTVGGAAAPAGESVTILFDGVSGPSTTTVVDNGQAGYAITYGIGSAGCANSAGATITVIFRGQAHATGHAVPAGNLGTLQIANITAP